MNNRDVVILLDIDNTLLDFEACTDKGVVWNGGLYLWQAYLELLITAAKAAGITIHIGIATFKDRIGKSGNSGDSLSATVLEDKEYKHEWIKPGCGLRKYIEPDLEFFTSFQSKIEKALDLVKNKYPGIASEDIFIIDDMKEAVCDKAIEKGYSAYCVGEDMVKLTHNSRASRIAKVFANLFTQLKLDVPQQILAQTKEPEVTLEEIAQMMSYHRNRLHSKSTSTLPIESPESLHSQGIQSLDDDEENYINQPH